MNKEAEKRIAAKLAKTMAMMCLRNTHIETIHAGKTPVTKTGDWSDVTVLDAAGNRIPWTDVSHINDDQMRDLMRGYRLRSNGGWRSRGSGSSPNSTTE